MKISAGVLLVNENNEILLGHATGQNRWDIPKGQIDPGESPLQAAIRELEEETSIKLNFELTDLGEMKYIPKKNLHLFLAKVPKNSIEPEKLVCKSFFFSERFNAEIPEMDKFQWVCQKDISFKVSKGLNALLESISTLIFK